MSYRIYTTKGIVLKKKTSGEQNSLLYVLTKDLGLIIASARSTRTTGSKLRGLLEEYSYGEFSLVKGKNGWRLTNASSEGNFYFESQEYSRKTVAQICSVLTKMIQGEVEQEDIYDCVIESFQFLTTAGKSDITLVETLTVLRIMNLLGYVEHKDGLTEIIKGSEITPKILNEVFHNKIKIVGIINMAIKESQL